MNNEIKREMEKIEIPEELHARSELGIKQVKKKGKKSKRNLKWIIGVAASFIIIGTSASLGGPNLVDATATLLGKVFDTEKQEQFHEIAPDETEIFFPQREQHLELAKAHLSPEDFENYSQLIGEMMEIDLKMANNPSKADKNRWDKRVLEIQKEIRMYGVYALTTHTLEEAQAMVSYPINHPTYIPEGYELAEEEIRTDEESVGVDPEVVLQYVQKQGEFGFRTTTEKIDQTKENELKFYDTIDSYQLNGYDFEHAHDDGEYHSNVQGMRVIIPEEGYEVTMSADILSKEDMEKVLLSIIE